MRQTGPPTDIQTSSRPALELAETEPNRCIYPYEDLDVKHHAPMAFGHHAKRPSHVSKMNKPQVEVAHSSAWRYRTYYAASPPLIHGRAVQVLLFAGYVLGYILPVRT